MNAMNATGCGHPHPEQPLSDHSAFDWNSHNAVCLHEQPRTAVYVNDRGQLVIRQEAGPLEEQDSLVFFNSTCLPALIAALQHHVRS